MSVEYSRDDGAKQMTYREAIREALREALLEDGSVVLIGEEIADPYGGSYKVTLGLSTEFGDTRVRKTPISEAAIVGCGVGAAIAGMKPIVEIMYIDFATCAMDQIVNQAAKLNYMSGGQIRVPLVIRMAAGAGRSAAAQHSQSLEAWFCHTPGLKVAAPATPYDAKGMIRSALQAGCPVILIEHKLLYGASGEVPTGRYTVPFGQAKVIRSGKDVTLISYSYMVHKCLAVAESMAPEVSVEVVDLRSLKPLDVETIVKSAAKTGRAILVQEAPAACSVSAEVSAVLAEHCFESLRAPVIRVTAADTPIPFSPLLERAVLPSESQIVDAMQRILGV